MALGVWMLLKSALIKDMEIIVLQMVVIMDAVLLEDAFILEDLLVVTELMMLRVAYRLAIN